MEGFSLLREAHEEVCGGVSTSSCDDIRNIEIMNRAITLYNSKKKKSLVFDKILEISTQLVAGRRYFGKVQVKNGKKTEIYAFDICLSPYSDRDDMEITSWNKQ